MLNKFRIKLVIGYTFAIIAIMVVSFIAGYIALEHITVKYNKRSLLTYLNTEAHESIPTLKKHKKNSNMKPEVISFTAHKLAFNNIVYLMSADGKLIKSEELDANISEKIREVIADWNYPALKVKTLYLSSPNSNTVWHFLMVSQDIYEDGALIGKVIVGTNLSPLDRIASRYVNVAILIIFIVSILAYFIGNFFASKAIKPIKISIQKQKEFIGDASHEMRTPLSVLLSSVDMLEGSKNDKSIIKNMKTEILNMRSLISNLLILARTEDEKVKSGFSEFNLSEMILSLADSNQILADKKNIKINIMNDEKINIFANESNISNLLNILLDNAIKYSYENTEIIINVRKTNVNVKIKVKDEGIGIKSEDYDKIFERFYRVDKSRSRSQGSFGLGLSLAKKIIFLHNGKIEVESFYGQGSTFIITLPLS